MFKTVLCAAALTLSLFAANASAASTAPARIEVSNGSHGFMQYGYAYCKVINRLTKICYASYGPRVNDGARTGKVGEIGFRQGKFRSK
jgi:hypothetical protein